MLADEEMEASQLMVAPAKAFAKSEVVFASRFASRASRIAVALAMAVALGGDSVELKYAWPNTFSAVTFPRAADVTLAQPAGRQTRLPVCDDE